MWRLPFTILFGLNIADFTATALLINRHGYSVEQNPILYNWIVAVDSPLPILLAKCIPLLIFALTLKYFEHRLQHRMKLITISLWVLNIGLSIVVIMGILMLFGVHISI